MFLAQFTLDGRTDANPIHGDKNAEAKFIIEVNFTSSLCSAKSYSLRIMAGTVEKMEAFFVVGSMIMVVSYSSREEVPLGLRVIASIGISPLLIDE